MAFTRMTVTLGGNFTIKVDYECIGNVWKSLGQTVHERWIRQAFQYGWQTEVGEALIRTASKFKNPETGASGDVIQVWLYNTSAYDPKTQIIKWNPTQFAWFCDAAKSWSGRTSKMPEGFKGAFTRPNSEDRKFDTAGDYVLGATSAPVNFLHEIGHRVQHLMKKPYFNTTALQFSKNMQKYVEHDNQVIAIQDGEYPWEMDNVNWHEQPMIKQLQALGLADGVRWYYRDSGPAFNVDDWELVTVLGSKKAIKVNIGGTWYKHGCFWKVSGDGSALDKTYLKAYKKTAVVVAAGIPGKDFLKPATSDTKHWWKNSGPGT